jgi:hypothetical protein
LLIFIDFWIAVPYYGAEERIRCFIGDFSAIQPPINVGIVILGDGSLPVDCNYRASKNPHYAQRQQSFEGEEQ